MPTIRKIGRYRVFLYSNEGELHRPAKIFVSSDSSEAEFFVSSDENPRFVLKRSHGFETEELSDIYQTLSPIAKELRSDWFNGFT